MTNYNDGKWHSRKKGETIPLHEKTEVQWMNTNGDSSKTFSGTLCWDDGCSEVIAFRVIKEHREPKEYTIDPRKNIIWYSSEDDLVHVKELDK